MRVAPLIAALLLLAPAAAGAACVRDALVTEEARAAAVRPDARRLHFVRDGARTPGCPAAGAACRERAFLTPGDVVVTGPARGAYLCAGFVGAGGTFTAGWLPAAALAPLPEAEQAPAALDGRWVAVEKEISIRSGRDGALAVTGDATWGIGDPERLRRGGVHTGELAGEARPEAGVLAFTVGEAGRTLPYAAGESFDCRIRLWRRGPYLLARDNFGCGGHNVTFTDLYRRAEGAAAPGVDAVQHRP